MTVLRSPQKKTLLAIASATVAIICFQNCAKNTPQIIDPAGFGSDTVSADHDPLKADSSNSFSTELPGTGPLYTLVRVASSDADLSVTAGVFKIRLNENMATASQESANDPEPFLTTFDFSAMENCDTVIEGNGQMTRFRGLPVSVGAVNFNVTTHVGVTSLHCPVLTLDDQKLLQSGVNDFEMLLKGSRTFTILGDQFTVSTHDGHALTFKIQHEGIGIDPDPSGSTSEDFALDGTFEAIGWEGNLCTETASAEAVCTMIYGIHPIATHGHRLTVRTDRSFSLKNGSQYFRGHFSQGTALPNMKVTDFILVPDCSDPTISANVGDMEAASTILSRISAVTTDNLHGSSLDLLTSKGNRLKLNRITTTSSPDPKCW